jgi:hypothetical protein
MLASHQGCFANLVMEGQGSKVIDGVNFSLVKHLAVISEGLNPYIILKIAEIGVRSSQRVARFGWENRRAGCRPLATPEKHQGILLSTGSQGRNPKVIDAGFSKFLISL